MATGSSHKSVIVLLAIACMFLVYVPSTSSAQGIPPSAAGYEQCLSQITSAGNCAQGLHVALVSLPMITELGPECCKVVGGLSDNCWSLLFPLAPNFSSFAKTTLCSLS